MKNFFIKIKDFFFLYKWLLLLSLPVIIFLFFIISLIFSAVSPTQKGNLLPTITPVPTRNPAQVTTDSSNGALEDEHEAEPPELRSNFQKKETRSDGSIVYTFSSGNPQRPNVSIITSDEELLFSRDVEQPLASVSAIINSFGEPERIINGSKFYGQQANVYIYASSGYAFIGNPNASAIFEAHHFPPMSVDEYLQRFGDQN